MLRTLLALALTLASQPLLANSDLHLREAAFAPQVAQLERKNQAVLTYLWADVYAAALYTPNGISPREAVNGPHAKRLELYYFRDIARSDVIKAAWLTLERQLDTHRLAALREELDALHATFRDIRPGDRYALDYDRERGLRLLRNGETAFRSTNPELADAYLGIWLAPDGLSDKLREQLLAGQ